MSTTPFSYTSCSSASKDIRCIQNNNLAKMWQYNGVAKGEVKSPVVGYTQEKGKQAVAMFDTIAREFTQADIPKVPRPYCSNVKSDVYHSEYCKFTRDRVSMQDKATKTKKH
jgi:hypothetical protein